MYKTVVLLGLTCLCVANDIDRAQACQRESEHTTRYYKGTKECYQVPSQGPCEDPSMVFMSDDDYFGSCNCKEVERRTAYYPSDNKCYSVHDTGFCPKGKALLPLLAIPGTLSCQEDPCYEARQENSQLIAPFKGECVTVGANCDPNNKAMEIRFTNDGITVVCALPQSKTQFLHAFSALNRACPNGKFLSANGVDCVSTWFKVDEW